MKWSKWEVAEFKHPLFDTVDISCCMFTEMQFYTFYQTLFYILYIKSTFETQPDSSEACLADSPELFQLGRVPRITTCPQIHINTRNRVQALADLFNLQKYDVLFARLSCNAHIQIQDRTWEIVLLFSSQDTRGHWVHNVLNVTSISFSTKRTVCVICNCVPGSSLWG